jgi:protein gp37
VSENSKIEWTHHTLNPWLGCAKVHAGCTHCYAEKHQAVNMRKGGAIPWGEVWQGGGRVVVSDSTWAHPLKWARAAAKAGERHRVFCASLGDVLEVPVEAPQSVVLRDPDAVARVARVRATLDEGRARLWDTIRQTAHRMVVLKGGNAAAPIDAGLDWLLLTKRPENWTLVPEDVRPLVWLGTSISDQETANEWVPRLLAAQGFRYRFLSVEPLLGPVVLSRWMWPTHWSWDARYKTPEAAMAADAFAMRRRQALVHADAKFLDWVIGGGESGSKARHCNVEWIRDIVRQCAEAGVPCFVKQLGALPMDERTLRSARIGNTTGPTPLELSDPKGGDWDEWPEDLRVRQFPGGAT